MSSNSPSPGRILRSHAKKPDDKEGKEKDNVKKEKEAGNESAEKDKKKRKVKATHNTSEDAPDSEIDVKINKPGKKKRKIHTRTAHSDGEQEFVELGSAKSLVKPKPKDPADSLTQLTTAVLSNDTKLQNIMEPIFNLRATLANVLAKLPKPMPPPSNGFGNSFGNSLMNTSFGDSGISSSSNNSNNPGTSSPANSNLSTFSAISANLNNMLNLASGNNNNNASSAFINNNNNNSNNNNNNLFSPLQPLSSQSTQSQSQSGSQGQNYWGSLMSQYPHHPNIPLSGSSYSIGRRTSRCNLALPDDFLSTTLCKIHYSNGVATIESCSGSSSLQLNSQPIRKGYTLVLRSGDELSFTGSKHYSFIFQLYNTTNTSTSPNTSSTPAGTSTTTSTTPTPSTTSSSSLPAPSASSSSSLASSSSSATPASSSSSSSTPATANSSSPLSALANPGNGNNNIFSFLDVEKSLVSPHAQAEVERVSIELEHTLPQVMETDEQNTSLTDPPTSPIPHTTISSDSLTPQKPASSVVVDISSPPPFSLSASAPTTTTISASTPPPAEPNPLKETFKTEMKDMTINPSQLNYTLEDFPYYLAKETKQMLVSAAYLFLSRPEYVKYTSDLPSVSRRILLEGPTGTDLYQETLVKALAKQFNAQLLMLDHAYFENKEKANSAATSVPPLSASTPLLQTPSSSAPTSLSAAATIAQRLTDLPDEDDSDLSSEEYGRRLNTFDVTKRRFKIDDRIKYTGPSPASFVMNRHHSSAASSLHGTSTTSTPSSSSSSDPTARASQHRGPQVGNKGKVVITFDDNPRRVGVRFDKSIAGGVDLGGLCEESHGFFVDTSEIKRESESSDDRPDTLAITGLFEILSAATTPTILCIKDAEKVLLANYERYAHIKREFTRINKLPIPVIIIGTNITRVKAATSAGAEQRRGDKGHGSGLLFSKAASHHTALLDLSFFDHISRIEERAKETSKTTKFLYKMLSNKISITPPKDPATLTVWREKLERDVEQIKSETNQVNLRKALERNNIECANLNSSMLKKQVFTPDNVEKIIGWAVSHHLMVEAPLVSPSPLVSSSPSAPSPSTPSPMNTDSLPTPNTPTPPPATPPTTTTTSTTTTTTTTTTTNATTITPATAKIEKLEITLKSIEYAIEMLTSHDPDTKAVKNLKDVETENEFEKRILSEVIPPHEIAIRFEDIGALGKVKETLKELVMLPLQRPELFRKGNLTKPCKGILLFGPPGTGKTMLAKAVATESGANFINVSMSTIGSKWFGEGEKYAKAVFTLAGKIAPSVIFIDEVDSILGKRDRSGEHEAMRKIKNEFMAMWDGLRSRDGERVLVLAATNRPFDLDDAVLRRLSRRLMVDLPDQENRTKILQVILAKEDLDSSIDCAVLASMTEGYSGSDLKNLSIAAAYQPIREFLRQEKLKLDSAAAETESDKEKREQLEKVLAEKVLAEKDKGEVSLRAITLADFVKAKDEVSPSVSEDAFSIAELRKWNDMYGEGGSRVKSTLTYFM